MRSGASVLQVTEGGLKGVIDLQCIIFIFMISRVATENITIPDILFHP